MMVGCLCIPLATSIESYAVVLLALFIAASGMTLLQEDAYVTFALDRDGSVERMSLRAISPLADYSFDYQDLLFRPEP